MTPMVRRLMGRAGHMLVVLLLASVGTIALMRLAPGYYTDAREMDAQHADGARTGLEAERRRDDTVVAATLALGTRWLHGDAGQSRQYGVPVMELIRPRLGMTVSLMVRGVVAGWLLAIAAALPLGARRGRSGETLISASAACLLALPVGAMATFCLLAGAGGPVLVLTVLVCTRTFKFLYKLLRRGWRTPHLLQARAQGIGTARMAWSHLLPELRPQLLALVTMSLVVTLGAIVPVEVVFNVPGAGQLAWTAAMNRDLPVLLAMTLLMTSAVVLAGMPADPVAGAGRE